SPIVLRLLYHSRQRPSFLIGIVICSPWKHTLCHHVAQPSALCLQNWSKRWKWHFSACSWQHLWQQSHFQVLQFAVNGLPCLVSIFPNVNFPSPMLVLWLPIVPIILCSFWSFQQLPKNYFFLMLDKILANFSG